MASGFMRNIDPPHEFPFVTNPTTRIDKPVPFSVIPAPQHLSQSLVKGISNIKAFSILLIPDLLFWLDANDISSFTFLEDQVVTWKDKSKNEYTAEKLYYNPNNFNYEDIFRIERINNKNYLLTGFNYIKIPNFTSRLSFTMFLVARGTFYYSIASSVASGVQNLYVSPDSVNILYTPTDRFSDVDLNYLPFGQYATIFEDNDFFIFTIGYNLTFEATPYRLNGKNRTTYRDYETNSVEDNSYKLLNLFLTFYKTPNETPLLGEIMHFDRSLSLQEVEKIEGYLAEKWDLRSKLPNEHPYKNSPLFLIN